MNFRKPETFKRGQRYLTGSRDARAGLQQKRWANDAILFLRPVWL
jgi:hypothetical protein